MVWPSSTRMGDFDAVSASYAMAAKDVDGLLLPAGDWWRSAWRQDAALALYGPDGFHPSPLGSYIAALAIYRGLTALRRRSSSPSGRRQERFRRSTSNPPPQGLWRTSAHDSAARSQEWTPGAPR
jgi:hypothetical protein